jgi:hypothetical protein
MPWLLVGLVATAAGCPKDPGKGGTQGGPKPRDAALHGSADATAAPAPDPYAGFQRSTLAFASAQLRAEPGTAWPSKTYRVDDLDALFAPVLARWRDGAPDRAAAEAELLAIGRQLGSFVLIVPVNTDVDAGLGEYDAAAQRFPWRGHGVQGVKLDLPLAFTLPAPISVGELPMGGSVNVWQPDLEATLPVPSGEADGFAAAHADRTSIEQHYLVELLGLDDLDGHPFAVAALHGVRVVSLPRREVLFVGAPLAPAPEWPAR